MNKFISFLVLSLLILRVSYGQDEAKYAELIATAWNLYQSKDYLASGIKYAEAFKAHDGNGKVSDRYNAACSWALAKQPDSAFVQLYKIANNGNYTNYNHITIDKDLVSLYTDERWPKLIAIVKQNKEKAEQHLDRPLVTILDSVYQDDQRYRHQIKTIEEKYGWDSKEMRRHWKLIHHKDSSNLFIVKNILDERGWLGEDVIGRNGNSTLFLVIQHADLETQQEYLPMMREAVKKGNARAGSLALLEDRVALGIGEKQIYGSQIGRDNETGKFYVLPLRDPDHVDQRRKEVGLGPLQTYVANWDITWDVEEYKREMNESEEQKQN